MKAINTTAPVQCRQQIEINAPIERVWELMAQINQWAEWQPKISKPQLQSKLEAGAVFTWRTGGASITSQLHTVDIPNALGWTGKTFGMYAIHNWQFSKTASGTLVSVEESMEGWLTVLLKKMFNANLEKDMRAWLMSLKVAAEKK